MALVDYASDDDDEDEDEDEEEALKEDKKRDAAKTSTTLKRKRDDASSPDLPPLPSAFHDLYASTTRVSTGNDPSLHGGRKRVHPHVEGNWPTHLYTEYLQSSDSDFEIKTFLVSDLGVSQPLHISFSRPIGFLKDQKDDFLEDLKRAISRSRIRSFDVQFKGLDWVSNFEGTRWFLVLRLSKPPEDCLNRLLHVSNTIVQDHDQPPLYAAPRLKQKTPAGHRKQSTNPADVQDVHEAFHFSIAWTLQPPSTPVSTFTQDLSAKYLPEMGKLQVKVDELKVKIGNVVTSIPFSKDVVAGTSLFGI